jgi:choline dehydrogenase
VAEAPFGPFYDAEELPGSVLESDSDLLDFARQVGLTAYHLCGTCQMGPRPEMGAVVDQSLRVHGIDRLRIADASIMPSVVSANTSAAVFMIGEKAADLVRETKKATESVFALAG